MPKVLPIDDILASAGRDLGTSDWLTIDQERVNGFADVTGDHQFIHTDPERATPLFGGTIAHGFLTLSLAAHLMMDLLLEPIGHKQWINYGLNKLRFVAPVLTGSRVRLKMVCKSVTEKKPGVYLFAYDIALEIEGNAKPAYIAEYLLMSITETAQ